MYIASVQFSSNIVQDCATTPPKAKCSKDCCDVSLIDCNAQQVFTRFAMTSKVSLSMHLKLWLMQRVYNYVLPRIV